MTNPLTITGESNDQQGNHADGSFMKHLSLVSALGAHQDDDAHLVGWRTSLHSTGITFDHHQLRLSFGKVMADYAYCAGLGSTFYMEAMDHNRGRVLRKAAQPLPNPTSQAVGDVFPASDLAPPIDVLLAHWKRLFAVFTAFEKTSKQRFPSSSSSSDDMSVLLQRLHEMDKEFQSIDCVTSIPLQEQQLIARHLVLALIALMGPKWLFREVGLCNDLPILRYIHANLQEMVNHIMSLWWFAWGQVRFQDTRYSTVTRPFTNCAVVEQRRQMDIHVKRREIELFVFEPTPKQQVEVELCELFHEIRSLRRILRLHRETVREYTTHASDFPKSEHFQDLLVRAKITVNDTKMTIVKTRLRVAEVGLQYPLEHARETAYNAYQEELDKEWSVNATSSVDDNCSDDNDDS